MQITAFGWRPSVIGFGQGEGDDILGDTEFPADYDPLASSIGGTRASGTNWGEKLLGSIFDIGTPVAAQWLKQEISGPAGTAGQIVTAPGGQQYQWNAAGQLVPLTAVSAAGQAAATKAVAAAAMPTWLLPAALGIGALVLLIVLKRK